MTYDSTEDTLAHIRAVQFNLEAVIADLLNRARTHDQSKLSKLEKLVFDKFTPKLRYMTYGSDEYNHTLKEMGKGLKHHYNMNDHHPEHIDGTIGWMAMPQMLEMLADWKAATERHNDGDLRSSIMQNAERFGYGPEMRDLLIRTAAYYGWLD